LTATTTTTTTTTYQLHVQYCCTQSPGSNTVTFVISVKSFVFIYFLVNLSNLAKGNILKKRRKLRLFDGGHGILFQGPGQEQVLK
jgi:hypothetical protein